MNDSVYPDGAVGVRLHGNLDMDTIVAQGCRPVGGPVFITGAARNRILEIDGRRPTEIMAEIFHELDPGDQDLFRRALFVGVVMNEGRSEYGHGDFLIRNVVGVDPETGTLTVAEVLHAGQVIQFHVRDALMSAADLEGSLQRYVGGQPQRPAGILLFSCLGRGETLYGEPDHDSRMIAGHLGPTPIGGFFCNGEIGPVDRRTFLHGYTSSIGVFRPRQVADADD
jgi:small ligand-binding sensory domain FIST